MALINQTYSIDLVPNGAPLVVNASQYDVGSRTLIFNLFNGGVAYAPDTGTAAYLMGTKPDNTGFSYAMTVNGTQASLDIEQQMTAVAGSIPCEIRLVDPLGAVIGTANFTLNIEKAALDDDTVISDSDIPVFEDLAAQAAASAASAAASAAIFPTGGTEGQVLTKTATGTAWEDAQGGATMVVNITQSGSTYTADKTFAEITAEVNNGGFPVAKYGALVFPLVSISTGSVTFGYTPSETGVSGIYITSANVVNYTQYAISRTRYYSKTLGSAEATSDSTVYSGGYKLTVTNSTITANSTAVVFFPNGDYSGNLTWITYAGYVELYFDQNPNSKAIRVEWKTLTYSSATVG